MDIGQPIIAPGVAVFDPGNQRGDLRFHQLAIRRHGQSILTSHGVHQQTLVGFANDDGWPRVAATEYCPTGAESQPTFTSKLRRQIQIMPSWRGHQTVPGHC
jgi:hypothetical protein